MSLLGLFWQLSYPNCCKQIIPCASTSWAHYQSSRRSFECHHLVFGHGLINTVDAVVAPGMVGARGDLANREKKKLYTARNLEAHLFADRSHKKTHGSPREDWLRTLALSSAVKSTTVAAVNAPALRLKRPVKCAVLVPSRGSSIPRLGRLNRCGLRSQARLPLAARSRPSQPKTMSFFAALCFKRCRDPSSRYSNRRIDALLSATCIRRVRVHSAATAAGSVCVARPPHGPRGHHHWHAQYTRIGPAFKKDGPHVPLVAGGREKISKGSGLSKPRGHRCQWYPVVPVVGKLLNEERVRAVKTCQEAAREQHALQPVKEPDSSICMCQRQGDGFASGKSGGGLGGVYETGDRRGWVQQLARGVDTEGQTKKNSRRNGRRSTRRKNVRIGLIRGGHWRKTKNNRRGTSNGRTRDRPMGAEIVVGGNGGSTDSYVAAAVRRWVRDETESGDGGVAGDKLLRTAKRLTDTVSQCQKCLTLTSVHPTSSLGQYSSFRTQRASTIFSDKWCR